MLSWNCCHRSFFVAPNSYWIYNTFWQLLVSHHHEYYNDYNYWCDVGNHNFQLHTVFHNYHINVVWVIAQILCICFVHLFVGFLSWLYFQWYSCPPWLWYWLLSFPSCCRIANFHYVKWGTIVGWCGRSFRQYGMWYIGIKLNSFLWIYFHHRKKKSIF